MQKIVFPAFRQLLHAVVYFFINCSQLCYKDMENYMHQLRHQFEKKMLIDKIGNLIRNNFRILAIMKLKNEKSTRSVVELLKNCLSDLKSHLEEYGWYFCYEGCKYYISQLERIIMDTSYEEEYYNALLMSRTSLLTIRKLLANEIFHPGDIKSTEVIIRNCTENLSDFMKKLLMNDFSSSDRYIIFVKRSVTANILSNIIKTCLNGIDDKPVVDFTIGASKEVMDNFRSGIFSILVVSKVLKEDIDMSDYNGIHIYDFPETSGFHVKTEERTRPENGNHVLHQSLKPVTKEEHYWFPNEKHYEKKSKNEEVYIKIPKYFIKCRPIANQTCYLHVIKINAENLKPTTCRRKVCAELLASPNELGIITRHPIPKVCDFRVCSDLGEVIINIDSNHRTLKLNEKEIVAVSEFHRTLFLKAIQVVKSFLIYSKDSDEPMGYFIVPLRPNADKSGMEIAFAEIPNQYAIPDVREPSIKERLDGEYSEENFRFSVVLPWYRKHRVEGVPYYVITHVDSNKNTRSPFPVKKFSSYADYYEKRHGLTSLQPNQPLMKARRIPLDLNFQPRETSGNEQENDEYLLAEFCIKLLFPSDYWYKSTILPTILYRLHYLLLAQELKEKFANEGGIGVQKWDRGDGNVLDYCSKLSNTQQFLRLKEGLRYRTEASKKGQGDEARESKVIYSGCRSSPPPLMVLKEHINYEGPKQEELLEALTTKKCTDTVDLERLEILGDSFIKFAVSFTILVKYPEKSEGDLAVLKDKLIGNVHLSNCGNHLKLGSFINVNNFKTRMNYWCPPGFVRYETGNRPSLLFHTKIPLAEQFSGTLSMDTMCNINADVEKFESDFFDKSTTDKKENEALLFYGRQFFGEKTIADVVEALTGVYVKTGGIKSAYGLLNYFGTIANPTYDEIMSTQVSPSLINRSKLNVDDLIPDYKTLEKRLSYEFNDKLYIVQAMTPASYSKNDVTVCYERLEFIGDAVLDFLVTSYIFEYCGNLSPGKITDLRSSLVNNTTFGALSVRMRFHEFLLTDDERLLSSIKYFEAYQKKRNHEIYGNEMMVVISNRPIKMAEEVEVPKVLGDIFESLAGAIFLDSGNNLNEVWRVYYSIMKEEVEKFSKKIPINPVRAIHEEYPNIMFEEPNDNGDEEWKKLVEGKMSRKLIITDDNKNTFTYYGRGENFHLSKRAAAKFALKDIVGRTEFFI